MVAENLVTDGQTDGRTDGRTDRQTKYRNPRCACARRGLMTPRGGRRPTIGQCHIKQTNVLPYSVVTRRCIHTAQNSDLVLQCILCPSSVNPPHARTRTHTHIAQVWRNSSSLGHIQRDFAQACTRNSTRHILHITFLVSEHSGMTSELFSKL